jgi:predicted phosphodiesterase
MFNILAIGDTHFKRTSENGLIEEMCNEIYKVIETYKIDLIVLLGDLIHDHSKMYHEALHNLTNFITRLSTEHEVVCLVGNHDYINDKQFLTNKHMLYPFKHYKNVIVADKVINKIYDKYNFTFVPYVKTGRFIEALQTYEKWERSTLIFAHQEFKGSYTENQPPSINGDCWNIDYPTVITGHIHKPQVHKNIIYTGTPRQNNYGEDNDKKLDLIHIRDNGSFDIEHIKLKITQKFKFTVEIDEILPLEDNITYLYNIFEKNGVYNRYKIVFNGYRDKIKTLQKNMLLRKIAKKYYVKYEYKDTEKIKSIHDEEIKYIEQKHNRNIMSLNFVDVVKDLLSNDFERELLVTI